MKCFSSCSTLSHFAINLALVTAPLQFFLFCVIHVTNCRRRLLSIFHFNWHTSLAALNIFISLKSIFFGFYFIFLLDWVHYIMTTTLSPRLFIPDEYYCSLPERELPRGNFPTHHLNWQLQHYFRDITAKLNLLI